MMKKTHIVTGHSKAKAPAHHKGRKATHMSIRPAAAGGFISSTMHAAPPMSSRAQSRGMMPSEGPEDAIHPTAQDLAAHVIDKFGGHPPMAGEDPEAAPPPDAAAPPA